ncbi:MAG TPA: hypothetical protein P5287_07960 [bacterium]|nr:hypothetical protein [bacterium]
MTELNAASKIDMLPAAEKAYGYYNWSLLILIMFKVCAIVSSHYITITQQINSVIQVVTILMALAVFVCVYRLTDLLKKNGQCKMSPVMWVVLMILPIANLIGIFVIFSKARKFIKTLKADGGVK